MRRIPKHRGYKITFYTITFGKERKKERDKEKEIIEVTLYMV